MTRQEWRNRPEVPEWMELARRRHIRNARREVLARAQYHDEDKRFWQASGERWAVLPADEENPNPYRGLRASLLETR